MGKLQWEARNRIILFLREKYIRNIWTLIEWEANLEKLTNLSQTLDAAKMGDKVLRLFQIKHQEHTAII